MWNVNRIERNNFGANCTILTCKLNVFSLELGFTGP